MNRAERRRKEKEAQGKKKTYTLTVEQIEQIKKRPQMMHCIRPWCCCLESLSLSCVNSMDGVQRNVFRNLVNT